MPCWRDGGGKKQNAVSSAHGIMYKKKRLVSRTMP